MDSDLVFRYDKKSFKAKWTKDNSSFWKASFLLENNRYIGLLEIKNVWYIYLPLIHFIFVLRFWRNIFSHCLFLCITYKCTLALKYINVHLAPRMSFQIKRTCANFILTFSILDSQHFIRSFRKNWRSHFKIFNKK